MEGAESPLDVLSTVASIVQENQALSTTGDTKHPTQQKQTTKWRRDRRSRLPEYSRKSDPKLPEGFNPESSETNGVSIVSNGTSTNSDTPLDMSVRQRGLPPSYAQTVNSPNYRGSYRPSVIHNGLPSGRDELPSGISMCDPIIDEHFRRSLGNDYHTVFLNNNVVSQEQRRSKSPPNAPTTNVIELMDSAGLSVDDHFAKALGDTWTKLNRKEPEIQRENSENLVSI